MTTEIREMFKLNVMVETPSVILQKIDVKFNSITLYSEDEEEEVVIKGREIAFNLERTPSGFSVKLFILNDGEDLQDRIDWLLDEDYLITGLDIEITNGDKKYVYTYDEYGTQEKKEIEIKLSGKLKDAVEYINDYIENKVVKTFVYEEIKSNPDLIEFVAEVSNIEVF